MKLITTNREFQNEFIRLLRHYNEYYILTAWAGCSFKAFDELQRNSAKIQKAVVGLHFYQTHPDFIEKFLENQNIKFIEETAGIFHPKLYLFSNSPDEWEMLVGSQNFTCAAFTKNAETAVLISNADNDSQETYDRAKRFISEKFEQGVSFDKDKLANYRKMRNTQQHKIASLSGKYHEQSKPVKPIYTVPILTKTWEEFYTDCKNEVIKGAHSLDGRLKVVEIIQNLFSKTNHFCDLEDDERKFISGLQPVKKDVFANWGWFGSMSAVGVFRKAINNNSKEISDALDIIPFNGQIDKNLYLEFFKKFYITFETSDRQKQFASATRLLAMKRPDVFVCFNGKNEKQLCPSFGITPIRRDYVKYWDDIIERIRDSVWYNSPMPTDVDERKVWKARVAFLDSLFYEP